MISKLTYGNSVFGIISYNEDKVKSGTAKAIFASNFPKEIDALSFAEKIEHFKNFTDLNTRTKRNAYHFAVSFSPKDLPLLTKELKENVVIDYMKGVGLEDQPYLVYEHFDTDHPHMHIVTTNINDEGKRIDIYRNVHEKSESIRKSIELNYNLTIAENSTIDIDTIPDIEQRLKYGKQPTKANLSKAVSIAIKEYKPSNILELKQVLSKYGVTIDEGINGSIQNDNKGLIYSFIDRSGKQVGKGIKASQLSGKPIYSKLDTLFKSNRKTKEASFKSAAAAVNEVYHSHVKFTSDDFEKALNNKGFSSDIIRTNTGAIQEIFYTNLNDGTIYNTKDFRLDPAQLREKFGDYSLTKSNSQQISKIIAISYRDFQRNSKIPFESTYLTSLNQDLLLERILVNHPTINKTIVTDSFRNYIDYKYSQLPSIYENDLHYFNKKNAAILRYISSTDFAYSSKDKSLFLKEFGLDVIQQPNQTRICAASDSRISMVFNKSVDLVLNGNNLTTLDLNLNYTKADKRLLHYLSERKNEHEKIPDDVNLYLYKKKTLLPFIKESDVGFIERTINKNYADKLSILVKNNHINTVQELMDYGLIIEPLSDRKNESHFILRYHDNKREYSIPVTGILRDFVLEKGYNKTIFNKDYQDRYSEHYDNFNLKYRLVSNLNRIGITKSYSGLVYAHDIISKRNEKAGKQISDFVLKTYNNSSLSNNKQYEKIRLFTLDIINKINNKEIGTDHLKENQKSLGKNNLRIASNSGIKMQKGSDQEEELRRKVLLKNFYNDLEK